jgi:transcriptional regulator with XRE-family HTH domain
LIFSVIRKGGNSLQRTNNGFQYGQNVYILCNIRLVMTREAPSLLPRISRLLEGYGNNLKLARLRRKSSAESVSQRAGISRKTLSKVENGDPAVALGIYARVMQVLRLENDLGKLAVDDLLGRKLQDADLAPRRRAPKRRSESILLQEAGSDSPRESL